MCRPYNQKVCRHVHISRGGRGGGGGSCLYIHQMPGPQPKDLQRRGISKVPVDISGHGGSPGAADGDERQKE